MANRSLNSNLHKANKAKKDEFYTQLIDIEKELKHYKEQFRGKVVYCNCDDPYESNFFKYFAANFNALGLKKLITTSYTKSPIAGGQLPLFEVEGLKPKGKEPFKIELNEVTDKDADGAVGLTDVKWLLKNDANIATPLKGSGDFRSEECIELLKQADIVVTNPPFSLFREYVAQLVEYKKKFLIIGNVNAITYKEIFPLIKDNKMWIGVSIHSGDREFRVPDDYPLNAAGHSIDKDGNKYIRVKGVRWFTNLDYKERHVDLVLYKKYQPKEYPRYDNYDAINVDKTADIPQDYADTIGVPITFMDKYNPSQFEIVALGNSRDNFTPNKVYINTKKIMKNGAKQNGNAINCVLAINQTKKPVDIIYYTSDNSDYLVAPYARILIKNKKVKKVI
ncbi:MAG: adenine-specific methyltransferase EcoRI family protein [Candidatus Moraniibacteriota bacterium]|nr:MAG: adenine-specific methyltransferase EcoRI family protein [Candidatus Moranbacteria bacterium]